MDELFGIPMRGIMLTLLGVLAVCLASVGWIAARTPVAFRIGVRNIPRRKTQTVLIVIGLMLSTLIIAASLGTGDTIAYSGTSETFRALGPIDELVVASSSGDGAGNIQTALQDKVPQSLEVTIREATDGTGLVDAVMAVQIEVGAVLAVDGDGTPTLSEPQVYLLGLDPIALEDFGGLWSVDGEAIDLTALPFDEVAISESLADQLEIGVGSAIVVYYNEAPAPVRVGVIAEDAPFAGRFFPDALGIAVPLERLQQATRSEGEVTTIAISNTGDERGGLARSDKVAELVRAALAGQPYGVDEVKQRQVELSALVATIFTSFFLVFGMFSIAVGVLLIVLIFSMLAAERRAEMGMTRAIGGQRAILVQQFVAEGASYALVAGLVGVTLGAAAAYAIGAAVRPLLGELLPIEPHVTLQSMVVAYCLGITVTFLAVVIASMRISRLNVVAAIRDIPDVTRLTRNGRVIVFGVALLLVGSLAVIGGQAGRSLFPFYLGMSLLPFGVALLLRFAGIGSRPLFTAAGIYLMVIWLLPPDTSERLWGDLEGGIEMFFLSGIFMVFGATIVIVQNLDLLLNVLSVLGDLLRERLPAVRTAVAFPSVAKGRTGLTIAMFSLIVFSLVVVASINRNFSRIFLSEQANAGWDVRIDSIGSNPLADTVELEQRLVEGGFDLSQLEASAGVEASFQVSMRRPGQEDWKTFQLVGMDDGFLMESDVGFQQRAEGYADDQAVMAALAAEPDAVVISALALAQDGGFGQDPNLFRLTDPDGDGPERAIDSGVESFAPIPVEIEATAGTTRTVRVIAVIDSRISTLNGVFGTEALVSSILPEPQLRSYVLRLADPSRSGDVATEVERILVTNGAQGVSIRDELEEQQRQSTGFLLIFQGFMGLGLIVGVAAVGVIAFRAVVERRQQIGVLRAIGFQQSLVSTAFLIETAFVVAIGVVTGLGLGLAISRNLFKSPEFAGTAKVDFVTPWPIIVAILVVTVAAALAMAFVPARQASRIAPAEALRYE